MTTNQVIGCCPLDCQDTCSWVAKVGGARVIRVVGNPDHPITRGVLCAKVNDYESRTYSADRLLYPLRRIGSKGEGTFERVDWDTALDIIATRYSDIMDEHGGEALMPLNYLGSMGVVQRRALLRLFHVLGASRVTGSICGASGNALADEGHPRGFDPEEMVDSKLILLWGANVLTTSHHQWHFIKEAQRRQGSRVVCIDPRRTKTAVASDWYLSIRPGSDSVLAAGIANVMLNSDLADREYARDVTIDLDEFCQQIAPWTPERVARVCEISAEDVIELGQLFGRTRPAVIRAGIAPQQSVDGEAFVRILSALAILGGHWQLPGGGLFIEANPVFHESIASRPDLTPGMPRTLDMARLGEILTDRTLAPPIKGLMIWGTNPMVTQPDVEQVRSGFAREDLFTVVLEHFLTDTARYADIVLPSTTQLEHFDIQGAWGHHYISLNKPAVAPLGESKSHGEVMRLLAKCMGISHPALRETDEEIAASALPRGTDLEELKRVGWCKSSPGRPTNLGLDSSKLRIVGGVPLPPESEIPGSLQLLTPKSHYFLNSSFANMPKRRTSMGRPTLEMSSMDAAHRDLKDGQRVIVKNHRGEFEVRLKVSDDIHSGAVSLPGKWWDFPTATSAVANKLTPSKWSVAGQPAYNETFVEVIGID